MTFREFYQMSGGVGCHKGMMLCFKDAPSRQMEDLWDSWVEADHQHIWWIIWNTPWIRHGVIAKVWFLYGDGGQMTREKVDKVLTNLTVKDKIELLRGTPNPFRS
jgi:hypothetical protein